MNQEDLVRIMCQHKTDRISTTPVTKAVYGIEPWTAAEAIIKAYGKGNVKARFSEWCKLTGRSGGVLLGRSLNEFFEWFEKQ